MSKVTELEQLLQQLGDNQSAKPSTSVGSKCLGPGKRTFSDVSSMVVT